MPRSQGWVKTSSVEVGCRPHRRMCSPRLCMPYLLPDERNYGFLRGCRGLVLGGGSGESGSELCKSLAAWAGEKTGCTHGLAGVSSSPKVSSCLVLFYVF